MLGLCLITGVVYYFQFPKKGKKFSWSEANNVISNWTQSAEQPKGTSTIPTLPPSQTQPRTSPPPVIPSPVVPQPATVATSAPSEKPTAFTNLTPLPRPAEPRREWRHVRSILDAQIALNRRGISSGCIDGAGGNQTRRALEAYQIYEYLPISGALDEDTRAHLKVEEPLFTDYSVTSADLERLYPLSDTWLGKSEQPRLDYETILELVAEKFHSHQSFIRNLNPTLNWSNIVAGTVVKVPRMDRVPPRKAAFVRIHLFSKTLEAFDSKTNLLAHFPCSIAQKVEKRPVGLVQVARVAANPTYLFNPEVFPESAEARKLGRKLTLPPGPNSPVGVAWIGLDKPGYGIHGTPRPEQVGRTESHGCFRLANWNAEYLLQMVWVGMPVYVER